MNEQVVQAVADYTGFTRWELILLAGILGLFGLLISVYRNMIKESNTAINNSTNAINNNTQAFKEFKAEILSKIEKD